MALITSDWGTMRSPSIKWPESPRIVRPAGRARTHRGHRAVLLRRSELGEHAGGAAAPLVLLLVLVLVLVLVLLVLEVPEVLEVLEVMVLAPVVVMLLVVLVMLRHNVQRPPLDQQHTGSATALFLLPRLCFSLIVPSCHEPMPPLPATSRPLIG